MGIAKCLAFALFVSLSIAARLPLHKFDVNEVERLQPSVNLLSAEEFLAMATDYMEQTTERRDLMKGLTRLLAHRPKPKQPEDIYWWYFPNMDCGWDDVGACTGSDVATCKAICLNTSGCGGFNFPHGILKKSNCQQVMAASTTNLYLINSAPQPPPKTNFPPIWPYPQQFTSANTTVQVAANSFQFSAVKPSSDLTAAFARYQALMFPHASKDQPGGIAKVVVNAADVSGVLQLETDESYTLTIPSDGSPITITAPTTFGAMYGLETLSQLITFNFDTKGYEINWAPWAIQDAPRFQHRELLVDTSRHFEPVQSLKDIIRSLPFSKINTVHWHLTDSQSFPFDSPSRPLLSQMGAYSSQERYSVEDVADVVEYARQHGVRMMVEVDNPGHAASFCGGYPEVCPSTTCLQPLNPATNATFDLLSDLFMDLTSGKRGAGLFYENLFHLGGDEVDTSCWTSTPSVQAWLTANGLTADGGYEYFVKRSQAIARSMGRDVVGWEEIWDHFGTELDPSTVIHQWLPGSTIAANATSHGYRVLWSTDGVWYLDGLGTTWQTMYSQEPCTGINATACAKYVLGGGGEMWGETVDTSDLQQTVWPRLAAIGERLWSPQNITDTNAAAPRYAAFRCLLNRRGVAAAPAFNTQARQSPPGPGGCYTQ
eukprot:TRINITY_DN7_c0_g1_i1.p1 TRINITY_DN7_c0_g1~~TRINITY_DN7_c0_g1_i1.p1  ORF type:complete len:669 (+),score=276.66 TRINITY_DN7_c0_g1_i1:39-2009(+)